MTTQATAANRSILLIEDDPSIRELLEELLNGEGYQVTAAYHGEHALEFLKNPTFHPRLILLDMTMEVMDGKTFIRELPLRCPDKADVPVVIMSAVSVKETHGHPLDRILPKPVDIDVLLDTVARFVC